MITITPYLIISFFLFLAGVVLMLSRKHLVAILLGTELILNASALNFVSFAKFLARGLDGHIFALFIIIVAAAEAAVGLAIVIRFFQIRESAHVDDANQLQG